MATRNFVPRATNEGGIGTAAKKWALGWINALVISTLNALTLAAQATGFTISGGTTPATLTVTQDTTLDEAVAMSSKAPKANPVFTGNVKGATGNQVFAGVNATNTGIFSVGGGFAQGTVVLQDNQSITITHGSYGQLILITNNNDGQASLFFVVYVSATITVLSDLYSEWVTTDTDSGKMAIFQAPYGVLTIKNYANTERSLTINILGVVVSSTAPA